MGNGFHPGPQVSQNLRLFLQLHRRFTSLISTSVLPIQLAENHTKSWLKRLTAFITGHPIVVVDGAALDKVGRTKGKFTPDMIRRMDEPPKPINPSGSSSGWVNERRLSHRTIPERSFTSTPELFEEFPSNGQACRPATSDKNRRRLSDPGPIPRMFYSLKEVNTILISLQQQNLKLKIIQ